MHKKKIMLAWELGGGLGHISRLLPLAHRFIEQDCEVVLVLRDLAHVPEVLRQIRCLTLQAPIAMVTPPSKRGVISFSDILWESGYFSAQELFGLTAGWQSLYDLVQPDLVFTDFAPTALLAARIYDFKTACLGGGFLSPPASTPWPDFRPSGNTAIDLLRERESAVLQIVNATLQAMGGTPLQSMADLFDVDFNFLCTWKELDCYTRKADTQYWGMCISADYGQEFIWPNQAREGIFCYLKHDQSQVEDILKALRAVNQPTLVYISGLPADWAEKYQSSNLGFAKTAVKLSSILPSARLVICPGGEGMIAASLLAGKPLLFVPGQAEQSINARKVEAIGAGIDAGRSGQQNSQADFDGLIQQLLCTPAFTHAAKDFAHKYRNFSSIRQIDEIVRTCLQGI